MSAIVAAGNKLRQLQSESGQEYLMLNRGVNAVCPIDLNKIIDQIDFNSADLQVYPGTTGRKDLRQAINDVYFNNQSSFENILITGGGIAALDLVFDLVESQTVFLPSFFWGSYAQLLHIHHKSFETYTSPQSLPSMVGKLKGSTVVICDPGNPLGEKYDDEMLLEVLKILDKNQVTVIFDSPYRRVFFDDSDLFYARLLKFPNLIITDSFSKSLGLSGQRIGFVHSLNDVFLKEASIRLLYTSNGINAFAQILVRELLTSENGKSAAREFRETTAAEIAKNIAYLQQTGFLACDFYQNSVPLGIFSVVNFSEEKLLQHRIGSVSMSYFTKQNPDKMHSFARVCVSVPHLKFVDFFQNLK